MSSVDPEEPTEEPTEASLLAKEPTEGRRAAGPALNTRADIPPERVSATVRTTRGETDVERESRLRIDESKQADKVEASRHKRETEKAAADHEREMVRLAADHEREITSWCFRLGLGLTGLAFIAALVTLAATDKPNLQTWATTALTTLASGLLSFALGRKTSK